jgi:methylthioribose-1-phosphate isomerase
MTDRPTDPPTDPPNDRSGDPAPDLQRRLFFRRFAGEVVTAATTVLGAASVLQQQSAEAAREMLVTGGAITPVPAGFRTAFRWDDDICRVIDQRHLPGALVEREIRSAGDAAAAIRERTLAGSLAAAQVAAIGLALTAARIKGSKPYARRATLRGAALAIRQAALASGAVAFAVERMLAAYRSLPMDAPGDAVAAELRREAEAIVFEATDAHGAIAATAAAALPFVEDRRLVVLTLGATGALGCGQYGTALAAIQSAHHAGREISAIVAEGRPGLEGLRVAAWELVQAGVHVRAVPDAAAAHLVAQGDVDVILVGAERIAANGDVAAIAGTYPLAAVAARHLVPVLVCAPSIAIDLDVPDGSELPLEDRRPGDVLVAGSTAVAPDGVGALNPAADVTPAELVTAIITEHGRLDPPFAGGLAEVVRAAGARRPAREPAPEPAPEGDDADSGEPGTGDPVP